MVVQFQLHHEPCVLELSTGPFPMTAACRGPVSSFSAVDRCRGWNNTGMRDRIATWAQETPKPVHPAGFAVGPLRLSSAHAAERPRVHPASM